MTIRRTQGGFARRLAAPLGALLAAALLVLPLGAQARTVTPQGAPPTASLPFEDIVPDTDSFFSPDVALDTAAAFPGRKNAAGKNAPEEADAPSPAPKEAAAEEAAPAVAKKGEQGAAPAAAPPVKQLYKVYAAPTLVEAPMGDDAAPAVTVIDTPGGTTPAPQAEAVKTGAPATAVGAPPTDYFPVVAVSGMPSQYFPILPMGAAEDAVPQLLPVASNAPLADDHSAVTRAILFIHDFSRNANEGLALLMTLAGSDNGATLILAPQFPLTLDVQRFAAHMPNGGQSLARWSLKASNSWQTGGESLPTPGAAGGVSAATALDFLLLYLADRTRFPQLRHVVVVGHGVGAELVQRYAALGLAPDVLAAQKLPLRFVVANASSYLYFTPTRPAPDGLRFAAADTVSCPGVSAYPYGLGDLPPYARRSGVQAIRLRYPERQVIYLLGDKFDDDAFLDRSCAAKAQGADRLQRGRLYQRYLMGSFGEAAAASQSFVFVPKTGYDPVALFGSPCGMAALFGEGGCGVAKNP